jgi:hypothetical protein
MSDNGENVAMPFLGFLNAHFPPNILVSAFPPSFHQCSIFISVCDRPDQPGRYHKLGSCGCDRPWAAAWFDTADRDLDFQFAEVVTDITGFVENWFA